MRHFLLYYHVADDYLERREIWRPEHFKYAWAASERGDLVVGGAVEPQEKMCVIMIAGPDRTVAERFAEGDPYVREGLVRSWRVVEWYTVAGRLAAAPIAPPPGAVDPR